MQPALPHGATILSHRFCGQAPPAPAHRGVEEGMSASEAVEVPSVEAWAWSPPPARPVARGGEVHIWRAALDRPPEQIEALASVLAPDEAERAARFHFRRDRDRYVAARGLLRTILGRYLGAAPERPRFVYVCVCGDPRCVQERRKPALAPEWGGDIIRFNLSHADGLAVYAIARAREVGIDLERVRSDIDYAELAAHGLTPREAAAVRSQPRSRQPEAFLAIWTRKEAYLKGRGVGLSAPLEEWEVQSPRDAAVGASGVGGGPSGAAWNVRAVPVGPGHVAALAVDGPIERLSCWDWPDE
jgi:4'-phosphopantetheinyl transferase